MRYRTAKRINITIYIVGLCAVLVIPLLVQKRDPTVYVPSWARSRTGQAVRPYDIVNDPYGYKWLTPRTLAGGLLYVMVGAFVLSNKASKEAQNNLNDRP